jgi:hypothetical protein
VGKIQAIIFDIGRVLVRLDIAGAMQGLSADVKLSPQETWSAIEHDPRWIDWQEGRLQPRDWYLHISRRLGVKLPFEEFVDVWNKVLDPQPILDDAFRDSPIPTPSTSPPSRKISPGSNFSSRSAASTPASSPPANLPR